MKSLTHQFADWVRTKPRDEAYDFYSPSACAFAQFAAVHGIPFGIGGYERLPERLRDILAGPDDNFGALSDRLAKLVEAS